MLGTAGTAYAFEVPLDNPDITMRWDNTIRYNLGVRMQAPDSRILASPSYDEGDSKFEHDGWPQRPTLRSEVGSSLSDGDSL